LQKKQGKLWQKERGLDDANPLDTPERSFEIQERRNRFPDFALSVGAAQSNSMLKDSFTLPAF